MRRVHSAVLGFVVFLAETLQSCCVTPFPVWVSCDFGQETGIGIQRASELHEKFPAAMTTPGPFCPHCILILITEGHGLVYVG